MTDSEPLPLSQVTAEILSPMFGLLLPEYDSREARVLLLAIGLQESRFAHRRQVNGPARGFWQFEKGGGVVGVLTHPVSRQLAISVCRERLVHPNPRQVYGTLELDDLLAAAFARLLLLTDPKPLPALGRGGEAWEYYLRNWRPGKPHPHTWNGLYAQAMSHVQRSN